MTPEIEVHSGGLHDTSTLVKSQVFVIFGLQAIGYTLGLFPMVKDKEEKLASLLLRVKFYL
jgi:hypothetical protein